MHERFSTAEKDSSEGQFQGDFGELVSNEGEANRANFMECSILLKSFLLIEKCACRNQTCSCQEQPLALGRCSGATATSSAPRESSRVPLGPARTRSGSRWRADGISHAPWHGYFGPGTPQTVLMKIKRDTVWSLQSEVSFLVEKRPTCIVL